jgi:hypothetical protein
VGCVWGWRCVCTSPLPLSPLCTACVVQGAACAVVCVSLCWSACGVGEVGRRALAGVWCFCSCISRGLHFLPEQSALPPPTSRSPLLCLFACVCFAIAVHHWPLGLAPKSPSNCCRIHRGMGGWGCGGGGGRASHTRCPPGDPHPCTLTPLSPSPHTQFTRIIRTLYHPTATHLSNNRWEGDRDGCHDMLALL